MEIRDLYGLLIDRMQGVPGTVRSGGDGGAARLAAPPPTAEAARLLLRHRAVGADGKATVTFDIPDFNGTVRVMAMAWTQDGVGHATKDVIVRDPVVVTASMPRFLAIGDTSRLLVEVNNVAGARRRLRAVGRRPAAASTSADADAERIVTLAEKQRVAFILPITGATRRRLSTSASALADAVRRELFRQTLDARRPAAGLPVTRRTIDRGRRQAARSPSTTR